MNNVFVKFRIFSSLHVSGERKSLQTIWSLSVYFVCWIDYIYNLIATIFEHVNRKWPTGEYNQLYN